MTMPLVDVPRCPYCFMPKGYPHYQGCTHPGLKAEIVTEQKRVLYSMKRCRTCGTTLVDTTPGDGVWRCPSDWCPSNELERKVTDAGESIGTAILWAVRVVRWIMFGTFVWLAWRAWTGQL